MKIALLASLFCACYHLLNVSETGEPAKNAGASTIFDSRNPDTWQTSIDQPHAHLSEIFKALSEMALDEKRSDNDRSEAVFAIAKIDNQKSLDFLVANISLYIPFRVSKLSDDQAKDWPCEYLLLKRSRDSGGRGRNLNIVGTILDSLDKPKTKRELLYYAIILKRTLVKDKTATNKQARMLIDFELQADPGETRKENLEALEKLYLGNLE